MVHGACRIFWSLTLVLPAGAAEQKAMPKEDVVNVPAIGQGLSVAIPAGNAVKHFGTAFSGLFAVAAFARTRAESLRAPHSGECGYENASQRSRQGASPLLPLKGHNQ